MLLTGIEKDLVHLLEDDNEVIKEGVLHVLAKAGGTIREQLGVSSRLLLNSNYIPITWGGYMNLVPLLCFIKGHIFCYMLKIVFCSVKILPCTCSEHHTFFLAVH